jgi:hypothetical protein
MGMALDGANASQRKIEQLTSRLPTPTLRIDRNLSSALKTIISISELKFKGHSIADGKSKNLQRTDLQLYKMRKKAVVKPKLQQREMEVLHYSRV